MLTVFNTFGALIFIVCAFMTSTIAGEKGYNGLLWFFSGLIFGPLGLLSTIGLPNKKLTNAVIWIAENTPRLDEYDYEQ